MSSHSACGVIGHVDPKEVRDKKKPLKSVDKIWGNTRHALCISDTAAVAAVGEP